MKTKNSPLVPLGVGFASIFVAVSTVSAVPLTNANFDPPDENTSDNGGVGYGPLSGWVGGTGVGVNNSGQPFLNQTAHSGTHSAFIQNNGATSRTISQTVSGYDPTKLYTATYFVGERGQPGASIATSVSLDGGATSYTLPGNVIKRDAFRRVVSGPLAVSGASSTIQISALGGGTGDRTLLIDSVSITRAVPTIVDGGFENPVQPDNTWKQANGAGTGTLAGSTWTFGNGGGITDHGSAFAPPVAPEGSQAALLQNSGAQFISSVSGFEAGVTYSLSFEAAGRNFDVGAAPFQVSLGGTLLDFSGSDTVTPGVGSYSTFTSDDFTTAGGSLDLSFTNTTFAGDGTSFVDDIRFNFVSEAAAIPEPSSLALLGLGGLALILRRRK